MGKKFRSRSPENVVDEIEELVYKYKINDIGFMDDTFMLNKIEQMKLRMKLKARDFDMRFVASSSVDRVDQIS